LSRRGRESTGTISSAMSVIGVKTSYGVGMEVGVVSLISKG